MQLRSDVGDLELTGVLMMCAGCVLVICRLHVDVSQLTGVLFVFSDYMLLMRRLHDVVSQLTGVLFVCRLLVCDAQVAC